MPDRPHRGFRAAGLLFPITLYAFGAAGVSVTFAILTVVLAGTVGLEFYRRRHPGEDRWPQRFLIDPAGEGKPVRVAGPTLYLLSCWLVVLLFPRAIAAAAMVFPVARGPAAAFAGARFGRLPGPARMPAGAVAVFLACIAAGGLLHLFPDFDLDPRTLAAGAMAAAVMETTPLPVEDLFTVPLFGATVMKMARLFLS